MTTTSPARIGSDTSFGPSSHVITLSEPGVFADVISTAVAAVGEPAGAAAR